ncbi:uncharacterized protein BDV14DRAFT_26410 [Aspergillus stella-maris]|uniref:uncharacterized protein n=1 Tax=Aspergillus stella-maris TaxID=1810926 RepID=UPI003CCE0255
MSSSDRELLRTTCGTSCSAPLFAPRQPITSSKGPLAVRLLLRLFILHCCCIFTLSPRRLLPRPPSSPLPTAWLPPPKRHTLPPAATALSYHRPRLKSLRQRILLPRASHSSPPSPNPLPHSRPQPYPHSNAWRVRLKHRRLLQHQAQEHHLHDCRPPGRHRGSSARLPSGLQIRSTTSPELPR